MSESDDEMIARLASSPAPAIPARRRFVRHGMAALGAAALGAPRAHAEGSDGAPAGLVPKWTRVIGAPVLVRPYGMPAASEQHVVRRDLPGLTRTMHSSVTFTPLQDLHGIVTPSGLVYERHHAGVPDIDIEHHRLLIHGLVERPLIFTMDDLLRLPAVSRMHFLECGANSSIEWAQPSQQSIQFTHGMLSCCEWTGVPLNVLLQEAGLAKEASWLLAEGADAASLTRSIPIEKALDDTLVVYAQNGERLRPEQGYPLRLLVPGFQGATSVKWLRRLKVGDQPFMTREETSKYTDLFPDGRARQFTFVQEAKSLVTYPSPGQRLSSRGFHEITGLAWSGRGRISRVDVSVDGGRNWVATALQEPVLPKCLTRFRLAWSWQGEVAVIMSRAIDESGYVQPSLEQLVAVRGRRSIYHNNAMHTWRVGDDGKVSNVRL